MPKFRSWACGRKTLSEIYPHWRPVFVKDTGQIFFGKTMEIPFLRDIEQTCMLETLAIEPGDSHAQTKKTFQIQSNFIFDPRASSHAGRVWFLFAGCNFLNMDLKLGVSEGVVKLGVDCPRLGSMKHDIRRHARNRG
jgi:hypothetical protein